MRTFYRMVSTTSGIDDRKVDFRMFKDKRTADRMCLVRNQSGINTNVYSFYVKTTTYYDIYTVYRNYRICGTISSLSVICLKDEIPKLVYKASSLDDALLHIDTLEEEI